MNDIKNLLPFLKFAVFIFSFIIHEIAHGYAAKYCGDNTPEENGRLSLNPIKHFDAIGSFIVPAVLLFTNSSAVIGWGKPVPVDFSKFENRSQHIFTAAAGIIANGVLAIIGLILYYCTNQFMTPEASLLTQSVCLFCFMLLPMNIILMIFNMFPLCPMDGWVIVKGFSSKRRKLKELKINPYILMVNLLIILILLKYITPLLMVFVKSITIL